METRKCPRHDRELEELWKDQLDCLECFEEYHQDLIHSLSLELVNQDYQEGSPVSSYEEGRID